MTVRMFPTTVAPSYANSAGLVTEPSVSQQAIQRAYAGTVALPAPVQSTATTSTTGGTGLAASTAYFYEVTALNGISESLASNEKTVTTGLGSTNSNTVNWAAVTGAIGYRIYRGTTTGGENVFYTVGAVTTFVDTGAANAAGSPPATVALDVPGSLDGIASGDAAMLVNAGYVAVGLSGPTAARPPTGSLTFGTIYVDTTLAIVVFWDGANWRNVISGATA